MARASLKSREEILGFDDAATLDDMLAAVLQLQGKDVQAEEMSQRALMETEKVLGVDHPLTLTSVSNLALVLQDKAPISKWSWHCLDLRPRPKTNKQQLGSHHLYRND